LPVPTAGSKRDQIAIEVLTTERTYVEMLQLCIEQFLIPLRQAEPPLIAADKVTAIFSNVAEVL
jgi:hypothetical protein